MVAKYWNSISLFLKAHDPSYNKDDNYKKWYHFMSG